MSGDFFVTVILILNGMLGATILVLPVISFSAGYLGIIIITPIVGMISMYTNKMMVKHFSMCDSIGDSIRKHFSGKLASLVILNIIFLMEMTTGFANYFLLLIQQFGIIFHVQPSHFAAFFIALLLMALSLLFQNFKIGERIMGYGILATIVYLCFLLWAQVIADHRTSHIPAFGTYPINLMTSLVYGFSFHSGMSELLNRSLPPQKHMKALTISYTVGILIYMYICFGSFAIQNRHTTVKDPQQVQQYFMDGSTQWVALLVTWFYAFHFLSVIPEYTIIIKIKIFQLFTLDKQNENYEQNGLTIFGRRLQITKLDILVFFGIYLFYFLFTLIKTKISTVVQLLGSTFGYIISIAIPIILSIKCNIFNHYSQEDEILLVEQDNGDQKSLKYLSKCQSNYSKPWMKWVQFVLQIIIISGGFFIMVHSVNHIFASKQRSVTVYISTNNTHLMFEEQF